eukprot:gene10908-biopygen16827
MGRAQDGDPTPSFSPSPQRILKNTGLMSIKSEVSAPPAPFKPSAPRRRAVKLHTHRRVPDASHTIECEETDASGTRPQPFLPAIREVPEFNEARNQ